MVPGPAGSASPGNSSGQLVLRPRPDLRNQKRWGKHPAMFPQALRLTFCLFKFEDRVVGPFSPPSALSSSDTDHLPSLPHSRRMTGPQYQQDSPPAPTSAPTSDAHFPAALAPTLSAVLRRHLRAPHPPAQPCSLTIPFQSLVGFSPSGLLRALPSLLSFLKHLPRHHLNPRV